MSDISESIESFALSQKNKTKSLFAKVGLIGSGPVGQSVARMVSQRGMEIVFIEDNDKKITSVMKEIENELDRTIARWGMTNAEKTAILNRIKGTRDWAMLKGCDIVIEALESHKTREQGVESRKKVFKEIEKNVDHTTIIATNSTSLMATELISELDYPGRGISFHFLSPVAEVPIIEVVKGIHTSEEIYESLSLPQ